MKIDKSGSPGGGMHYGPGSLELTSSTLEDLIVWAYGVKSFQIVASQPWFRSERYNVRARAKGAPDLAHLKLLLQALLAERFQLAVHREMRQLPVFTLRVEPHGVKMQVATGPVPADPRLMGHGNSSHQDQSGDHAAVAELVQMLQRSVGRPIVDQTGLTGRYNFKLSWVPDESDPNGMTIFTAVKEQLGLRLESGKGPVEVLVVDLVSRVPTED